MPDLPTISGGPSETGSSAGSSIGITVSSHASANTKATAWTELIASTDYAANWLLVHMSQNTQIGASTGTLMDIGVGGSTAEQVLVPNLRHSMTTAAQVTAASYLMPLRIPAGTRISARAQSTSGGTSVRVTATAISSGIAAPPGFGRVEAAGANTATSLGVSIDCGGTAHTDVVGELIASTGFAYRWLMLSVGASSDIITAANTSFLVDICVGAGGSEVPIINDIYFMATSGTDMPHPVSVCFPVAIAAGSRLSARARCSVNTAGDRIIDLAAYGVG
jgi:hypothetical protein